MEQSFDKSTARVPGQKSTSAAMQMQRLKADTIRQYGAFSWGRLIKGALLRRTFRPIVTMRMCQAAAASMRLVLPFCKVLHHFATHRAAMDFPWRTEVGPGLIITHGWGLVVNEGVTIGKNVTLFHGVTLGQRDRIAPDGQRTTFYPVLEDEVWVGPNAFIIGGVTVGKGCRIAGGAFVADSVPAHCVVAGNPSAIVKRDCMPDVMNPSP